MFLLALKLVSPITIINNKITWKQFTYGIIKRCIRHIISLQQYSTVYDWYAEYHNIALVGPRQ